jgi:hypothetical protein
MNTDQLQMIVNAIQTLGIEGKSAFIWWLILDKLPSFTVWMFFLSILAYLLSKLINTFSLESNFAKVRDMLNVGSPGAVTWGDVREVFSEIKRLKEKK